VLWLTLAVCAAAFVCDVVVVVVLWPPPAWTLPDNEVDEPTEEPTDPEFVGVVVDVVDELPCDVPLVVVVELELPVAVDVGSLDVLVTGDEVDTADVVVPVLPTEVAETEQFIWLPAKFVV
jgi:hypothetical protein